MPVTDTTTQEIWKAISGHEDRYEVSSLGRVRNIRSRGRLRLSSVILKLQTNKHGQVVCGLSHNHKSVHKLVGRLVLRAFVGEPPQNCECSHLDGNQANNSLVNLIWETHRSNVRRINRPKKLRNPALPPVYELPPSYPLRTMWEAVEGWPYEVSRYGEVRHIGSSVNLRPGYDKATGYLKVGLCSNGRQKTVPVHRLVSNAFLGTVPDGYQVNHKDGNKRNNPVSNLEYVTHSGNARHAVRLGLVVANPYTKKLTADLVRQCRRTLSREGNVAQRARELGVHRNTLRDAIIGRTWRSVQP